MIQLILKKQMEMNNCSTDENERKFYVVTTVTYVSRTVISKYSLLVFSNLLNMTFEREDLQLATLSQFYTL